MKTIRNIVIINIIFIIIVSYFICIYTEKPSETNPIAQSRKANIEILQKQLSDCDSVNAEYFFNDIKDVQLIRSLYDSVFILNKKVKDLNAEMSLLKFDNDICSNACEYWRNLYRKCKNGSPK
jgi:uncharacterized protein YpmB